MQIEFYGEKPVERVLYGEERLIYILRNRFPHLVIGLCTDRYTACDSVETLIVINEVDDTSFRIISNKNDSYSIEFPDDV